jgi:hypothetical protein
MLTPAAYALLHDLAAAGVSTETGALPHLWNTNQTIDIKLEKTPPAPTVAKPVAPLPTLRPTPLRAPAAQARGEPGGVVIVSSQVFDSQSEIMLERMLAAVGLADQPRAVVTGETGLAESIKSLKPNHILVLGQAALTALGGRALGVEEWQAAPVPLLEGFAGPVGVTYPLEVLRAKPLMKKRAWQHLQKWQPRQA